MPWSPTAARRSDLGPPVAEGLGVDPGTAAERCGCLRGRVCSVWSASRAWPAVSVWRSTFSSLAGLAVVDAMRGGAMHGVTSMVSRTQWTVLRRVWRTHRNSGWTATGRPAARPLERPIAAAASGATLGPGQAPDALDAPGSSRIAGWSGGVGLGFGAGVTAPGVASPEGWQVSVARGWPVRVGDWWFGGWAVLSLPACWSCGCRVRGWCWWC